jgi:hypothetical protein
MPTFRIALSLALLCSLGPSHVDPSRADEAPAAPDGSAAPQRVTTDSPEFCRVLADRVAHAEETKPPPPPQVKELAEEGQHMCFGGNIRAGLLRLRRALLLLGGD